MADGGLMPERYCSAGELAGLPGMPGTERGVRKAAEREGWKARPRRRGKGLEYACSTLPQATQAYFAVQAANEAPSSEYYHAGVSLARRLTIAEKIDSKVTQRQRERGARDAAGLSGSAKARMDARLDVLERLNAYAQARKTGICAAMQGFHDAMQRGEILLADATLHALGGVPSVVTLRRWRHQVKTRGAAALAGGYGNRKGSSRLDTDPGMRDLVVGLIADKPHISAKLVRDALLARFPHAAVPAECNVVRWLARWKRDNAEAYMALTNPDAWKNRHMSAFGNASEGITRANQLWMMDSTPADLQLVDGRYTIIGVIDIAWRGLRLFVSKASNAEAVSQLTRRAILEWGVPEAIKMDNGSDYASRRFGQLLTALHVEARFSAPFSPWEKPHIERGFRTFSHSLLELLPGYTGHNVAEAQAIRARQSFAERLFKKNAVVELKLTAAELQEFCDRWCRDFYQHEEHAGLGGLTPFQKYAQLRDAVSRVSDVRALDHLLGEGRICRVSKKGIRLDKLNYIAPELAMVIGQDVLVRVDDADVGRAVVYHGEAFLCVADCPEVSGVSRREIAIEGKARQTKAIQEAKAQMRQAKRKAATGDIAREILDHKAAQHAALTALPAPNVVHITPALEAAALANDALAEHDRPAPVYEEMGPTTLAHLEQVREVLRGEQQQDETAEDRFRRAMGLLLKPNADLHDLERRFLRNHCNSAEFLGRWSMFEDFGPSCFGLSDEYAALLPDGAAYDRLYLAQHGD